MMASPSLHDHTAATDAVLCVSGASRLLTEATFRLDDGGLECELLTDLACETSALLAFWGERPVPVQSPPPIPAYIVAAAIEWRRINKRSY